MAISPVEKQKIFTAFLKLREDAASLQNLIEQSVDAVAGTREEEIFNEMYRACDEIIDTSDELSAKGAGPREPGQ